MTVPHSSISKTLKFLGLTRQDHTPNLPDWTKSRLIFYIPNNRISMKFIKFKLLLFKKVVSNKIWKKSWKKKLKNIFWFFVLFDFKSFKSQASGKENVWFPESLDFENSPGFQTGCHVWKSPKNFPLNRVLHNPSYATKDISSSLTPHPWLTCIALLCEPRTELQLNNTSHTFIEFC